ncbi:TPA: oxidoreductase, partial [Pseudomonas putida]
RKACVRPPEVAKIKIKIKSRSRSRSRWRGSASDYFISHAP